MPDFKNRSTEPEIMDNFLLEHNEIDPVLKELELINKLLGGFNVFCDAFEKLPMKNNQIICDWGCGGGDSLKVLDRYFKRRSKLLEFIGIDATLAAVEFARNRYVKLQNISFRQADVLKENFKNDEFDVLISSLFTHHFEDKSWVILIKKMLAASKTAVIINDLHRHWFAYYSIGFLTKIFSKSPMVKHDAQVSVLRGFTKKELQILLGKAGITNYTLKWMWAFRWQVIIFK